MYDNKAQSRKWLLTINNPLDHGMTHDEIIDRAQKFNPDYMCLADEIAMNIFFHQKPAFLLHTNCLQYLQARQLLFHNDYT